MNDIELTRTPGFVKRVRRHVVGRERVYFAVTAPGLEPLCRGELASPPLALSPEPVETGGVAFTGRLEDCQRANLCLRTATRVLMRVDAFHADGFALFEKHAAAVPWELFLPPGAHVAVKAAARRCRLIHSDALAERTRAAVRGRIGPEDERPRRVQTVHVRGHRDRFVLSLDSSGEPLYIRGLKTHPGGAPIRETLAAAVLKLTGYTGEEPLVDPMCGSGTFSLEAVMAARNVPAGGQRRFAFEDWPSFAAKRWGHLKAEADGRSRPSAPGPIHASDLDGTACRRLQETVAGLAWEEAIRVRREDFFSLEPASIPGERGLVVLNPPYGKRIRPGVKTPELYRAVARRLRTAWKGWRAALLVPAPVLGACTLPGFETLQTVHGGIPLAVHYGRVE